MARDGRRDGGDAWPGWSGCCDGPVIWRGSVPKPSGPRSSRQLVALGIDLVAGEVRNLLPDGVEVAGPTPVGDDPVGLLRSAEQLLGTVADVPVAKDTARLRVRVADLVGEADHQCRRLIDAHPRNCSPRTISWPGCCCSR